MRGDPALRPVAADFPRDVCLTVSRKMLIPIQSLLMEINESFSALDCYNWNIPGQ